MSSRTELIFKELALHYKAEAAVGTSNYVVAQGTDADDCAPAAASHASWPCGIALAKQATLDGDVEVLPFIPGQRKLLVDDGTLDASGNWVCPSAAVAGRVGKSTPTAGDVLIGKTIEAPPGAGKNVLVLLCSPFLYAAT